MNDNSIMPIGKEHKGKRLVDVPASYLLWLWDTTWFAKDTPLGGYIKDNMQVLKQQAKTDSRNDKFLKQ